jgi:hypothetical protein
MGWEFKTKSLDQKWWRAFNSGIMERIQAAVIEIPNKLCSVALSEPFINKKRPTFYDRAFLEIKGIN